MEKFLLRLKDDRLVCAFAALGALMIAFPAQFTGIAPHVLGALLILYAAANFLLLRRNPALGEKLMMRRVNPGQSFVFLVLGIAVLVKRREAIGPLGSIWAVLTLYEVLAEINEMAREKHFPVLRVLLVLIETVLAIMLLFDPEEHFTFHVRILGIEMILYAFERRYVQSMEKRNA